MRWVFFVKELTRPVRVAPGEVREVPDEWYERLRALPEGADAMLDLTPRPARLALDKLSGRTPFYERPHSTVMIAPCPECMRFDVRARQFICLKPHTLCGTCHGAQCLAVAWNPDANEFRRRVSEAVTPRRKDGRSEAGAVLQGSR